MPERSDSQRVSSVQARPEAVTGPVAAPPVPLTGQRRRRSSPWRAKVWVLAIAVLAGDAAYGISTLVAPTYRSTAMIRVASQTLGGNVGDSVTASNDLARQYAQIADSPAVLRAAARRLGVHTSDLSGGVSAGTVSDQNLVSVSAQAGSARDAARRANAVGRAFVVYIRHANASQASALRRTVTSQPVASRRQITSLREQIARETRLAQEAPQAERAAADAAVAGDQALLASLVAGRQALLADVAQGAAAAQPSIQVLDAASKGEQVQPKPVLYAVIAFLAVFLVAAQAAALLRRRQAA